MLLSNKEPLKSIVMHDNVTETAVLKYSVTYNICVTKDDEQTQSKSFKNIKDLDDF